MTNQIEEMMKTAGCKKQIMCEWTCKDAEKCNTNCEDFETKQNVYPPFTAEKQLEVIKLIIVLAERTHCQLQVEKKDNVWIMYIIGYDSDFEGPYSVHSQDFTQALAQLTTKLINAGELDKEKVKGILEG